MDIAITTGAVRARHVRGVVLTNGQPTANASITVIPRLLEPSPFIPSARSNADGSFDVPGVLPGAVVIYAATNPGATGEVLVQVGDADLSNLVITVAPGSRVSGRFIFDGRSRSGESLDVANLRVTLRRDPEMLGSPQTGPSFTPPPAADGTFVMDGVPGGDFQVGVRALPPDAYIKSMRMGAADVLENGLHLTRMDGSRS